MDCFKTRRITFLLGFEETFLLLRHTQKTDSLLEQIVSIYGSWQLKRWIMEHATKERNVNALRLYEI
jgi:hypothetical protein